MSEMNRVPSDGSDEPMLRYNNVNGFRDLPDGENRRKRLPKCCFKCCTIFLILSLIICGAVAIAFGVSHNYIDGAVKAFVASKVALVKGSQSTDNWAQSPAPVYFKVYMFNLTNKEEFLQGKKPNFVEVGPFVYIENKTKFDLVWNEDETILRYNESCIYTYDKDLSNKLDPKTMNITTINLPLMGLLIQFEKLQHLANSLNNSIIKIIVDDVIKGFDEALRNEFKENLFMSRSVDEIVWGYDDPFLKFLGDLNLPIPESVLPKSGRFQLEEKSGYTGPNMIYTGKGNPKSTASFIMWNGFTAMSGWGTPYASMINGTEAIMFHPGVSRSDNLTLFVSELFRSGYFSYHQDVEEFGVKMYQFRLPIDLLNGNYNDKGFNMNGPPGALNLTAVYPLNVPVYVTKPHFLDADYYRNLVTGLKPNRDKHDAFLNVEPITGAVLHAAKRLQINIQLQKNTKIDEFKSLPEITYLPLLWVEEGGKLNSTDAKEFKNTVYEPIHGVDGGTLGLASAGGFFAVLSCLLLFILATYKCEKAIKRRRGSLSVRFDD